MNVFDGQQLQTQPVNLWNVTVPLNEVNNGLQFSPETAGSTVKAFDNLYQRHF
jgi:hypothetical protein